MAWGHRLYPKTVLKPAARTMLVPVSTTAVRGGSRKTVQSAISRSGILTASRQTQDTLSWLIRYQVNDELARQNDITVSAAQAQAALAQAYAGRWPRASSRA